MEVFFHGRRRAWRATGAGEQAGPHARTHKTTPAHPIQGFRCSLSSTYSVACSRSERHAARAAQAHSRSGTKQYWYLANQRCRYSIKTSLYALISF